MLNGETRTFLSALVLADKLRYISIAKWLLPATRAEASADSAARTLGAIGAGAPARSRQWG